VGKPTGTDVPPFYSTHSHGQIRARDHAVAGLVWLPMVTGFPGLREAELETIRLIDHRAVNKHYELSGRDNLDVLLDELVRLLVQHQVPDAAVVFRASGSSSQARDTEGS
jgi:hypothetical protein